MGQVLGNTVWHWGSPCSLFPGCASFGCPYPGQSTAISPWILARRCPSLAVPGPSHARFPAQAQVPAGRGLLGWWHWASPSSWPRSCPGAWQNTRPRQLHPRLFPTSLLPGGPAGAPTSGHPPAPCQLLAPRAALSALGRAPSGSTQRRVAWAAGPDPVPGEGSLAALPGVMLHLGTGIYPLAQLGPINSRRDGCQGPGE